jgi:P-type Mg2+ transporter
MVKTKTTVIRNGVEQKILPQDLCIGDTVLLNAEKIITADAMIVMAKNFFINQSSLAG